MTALHDAAPAGPAGLDHVRTVADAVLYEGYLLYPYRASSDKNRSRWQFGVLGPPSASPGSFGEEPGMAMQCLLAPDGGTPPEVAIHLRFLQVQVREVQERGEDGGHTPVGALTVDGTQALSWDEAVECEIALPARALTRPYDRLHTVPGGEDVEPLTDAAGTPVGRIVRRREPLAARIRVEAVRDGDFVRLSVAVDNEHPDTAAGKDAAVRASLIGSHLIVQARGARFVSLLEPPEEAADAAARCGQRRCWPVLAGPAGDRGHRAGRADHPLRPPRGGRAESRSAVRLHRDRRDPHPAGHDDDRRGEGGGAGHRPAGPGDHRPLRRHVGRGPATAARPAARPARAGARTRTGSRRTRR